MQPACMIAEFGFIPAKEDKFMADWAMPDLFIDGWGEFSPFTRAFERELTALNLGWLASHRLNP